MISYKYWKILNENRDVNLGIRSPSNLGVMGEAPMLMSMGMKRMSPDGGMGGPPMGKGKPPMGKSDMDDEDDMGDEGEDDFDDDEDDMGDEGEDDFDDDEDDDEDDGEDDDMGGDEEGDDEMGDEEEGPPMKPPMGKGKPPMGKPGMGGPPMESYYREGNERLKTSAPKGPNTKLDPQTKKDQKSGANKPNNVSPDHPLDKVGFCKKCSKMKKCAKCSSMKEEAGMKCSKCSGMMHKMEGGMKCKKCGMMKKMSESKKMGKQGLGSVKGKTGMPGVKNEHSEFYAKLQNMTGGVKFEQDELGFWVPVREDYLIAPEENEPKPGQVGYAPSQHMGISGGLSSASDSSYQEWLGKRRK
jgi:hypothetical protein